MINLRILESCDELNCFSRFCVAKLFPLLKRSEEASQLREQKKHPGAELAVTKPYYPGRLHPPPPPPPACKTGGLNKQQQQ